MSEATWNEPTLDAVAERQNLELRAELKSHEKECEIRYKAVEDKLESLDKRLWRLEALTMFSTLSFIAMAVVLLTKV